MFEVFFGKYAYYSLDFITDISIYKSFVIFFILGIYRSYHKSTFYPLAPCPVAMFFLGGFRDHSVMSSFCLTSRHCENHCIVDQHCL